MISIKTVDVPIGSKRKGIVGIPKNRRVVGPITINENYSYRYYPLIKN